MVKIMVPNPMNKWDDLGEVVKPTPIFGSTPIVPWSKVAILGMVIPPFNRNPYNGYIFTPTIGLMTIPYYMEIMGV